MRVQMLSVSSLVVVPGVQQRADGVDEAYVRELAEWLEEHPDEHLPPVVAFKRGRRVVLGGGHHTRAAYARAGRKQLPCDVREGGDRHALRFALGDNVTHGKRRSAADLRKAVTTALTDPELSQLTDREIDRLCNASVGYTSRLRKELTGALPDPAKSAAAAKSNQSRGAEVPHPAPENNRESQAKEEGQEAQSVPGPAAGNKPAIERGSGDPKAAGGVVVLPRDRLGRILPAHLVSTFDAGRGLEAAVKAVRSARGKAVHADKELLGDFLAANPLIGLGLDDADAGLSSALPYCVCPACGGDGDSERCPTCGGCGWLTRPALERLDPAVREEAARYAPGDAWEGDESPAPAAGPKPAFVPPGPGLDALGNVVPKGLRDVFGDEFLSYAAVQLDRLAAGIKSASAWCPWLRSQTWESLTAAAHQVRDSRPYAVCPRCRGKGCTACLTGGFLPAHMAGE